MADQSPRARPQQSLTARIASMILVLEIGLMFFVALVTFGLRVLPPVGAFGGAAAIAVLLGVAAALLRAPATQRGGFGLGWALQVVLIATGVVFPLMYFVGAVFAALYGYGVIRAQRLEARPPAPPPGAPDRRTDAP